MEWRWTTRGDCLVWSRARRDKGKLDFVVSDTVSGLSDQEEKDENMR